MPPDKELAHATPGEVPTHEDVQQLIEAERGLGSQGVRRAWKASDSGLTVLTSDASGVRISRDNGTTAPAQVVVDGTPAGGQLAGTYPDPSLSQATVDLLVPPGTVWAWAGPASPPPGWLPCDGVLRATATYPRLFAAIGYTYGGSGAAFATPNLMGRVVLGVAPTHGLSQVGGAEQVAGPAHAHPGLHAHGMSSHTHDISGHSHDISGHTHPPGLHTHATDIAHNHPAAAGAATASASTLNGRFTAGGANALPDTHTHPVDLPALGPTNATSLGPSAADTGTSSTPSTGTSSAASTGTNNANTSSESTAHAADYGGVTIATMMPFLTLAYMIRAG